MGFEQEDSDIITSTMADILIVRPSWPQMYPNLTLTQAERGAKESQFVYLDSIFLCVFIVVVIFHLKQHTSSVMSLPLALVCLFIGIVLSPVTLLLLLLFGIYRLFVRALLSKKYSHYRGLVDGADTLWCIEMDSSRSIVNILAFVELSSDGSCQDLRCSLKKAFEVRLLSEAKFFKLKCLRKLSTFGYFYWEEMNDLVLDDHIRWMDLNAVTEETVIEYVSVNCNNPLPCNNLSLWEVLVSKQHLTRDGKHLYPILFRMHHALGDGIALLNLFLGSLTDSGWYQKLELSQGKQANGMKQKFEQTKELFLMPFSECKQRSSTFLNDELKKMIEHCIYQVSTLLQNVSILFFAPYVLLSGACFGVDDNLLHGKKLVGRKNVGWAYGHSTLAKVKFIKNKLKYHFTDVIMLAISNVFEDYYLLHGNPPKDLTLVIPARLPSEDKMNESNIPTNRFTMGMLKLPICVPNKLQAVKSSADGLRVRPDYLVNYWILTVFCTYWPIVLIRDSVESKQATLAMTNIPGPGSLNKIDGNTVQDLVFWPPNRDTTGVGISILSYAGKLNFGLIVDTALIPNKEDVTDIARRMVDEIDKIYNCVKEKYD